CSALGVGVHRPLRSFPTRRSSDLVLAHFKAASGVVFPCYDVFNRFDSEGLILGTREEGQTEYSILPQGCYHLGRKTLDAAEVERSEEHTSELQSRENLVCRLLLEK